MKIPMVALCGATAFFAGVPPTATGAIADDELVVLPPLLVESATVNPPWRHARAGRFAILSCCPDQVTRDLARSILRAHERLHVLLPETFVGHSEVPDALIFYDEYYWPVASREAIATRLRSGLSWESPLGGMPSDAFPAATPPGGARRIVTRDPLIRGGDLHWEGAPANRRVDFFGHLQLSDLDSVTTFILVSRSNLDLDGWHLSPGSVRELLERRVPALPPWFVGAFHRLYSALTFSRDGMTLPPAVWISAEETRRLNRDPASARAVMPLADFFAQATPESVEETLLRQSQAELFVRWALEPEQESRRHAFWKFLDRACSETPDEALVETCFGVGFATMTAQLTEFRSAAVRKPVRWRAPPPGIDPPLDLREASVGEVARIKGNWERLETRYVRQHLPAVESRYYDLAHHTFSRALDDGTRDPAALAGLGLLDYDAGNFSEAHDLLREAAGHGSVRPQAALHLAKLRFEELRGTSTRAHRRLDRREAGEVLDVLARARRQNPPLLATYELVAAVWDNCDDAPGPDDLAVLDEGVTHFPRHDRFVFKVASIHAAHGSLERAAALVELALRAVRDEKLRQQLFTLRETIVSENEAN